VKRSIHPDLALDAVERVRPLTPTLSPADAGEREDFTQRDLDLVLDAGPRP
jgi:hypothetical protein